MNEVLDKDEVTALWWLLSSCVDKPEAISNILSSPDESQEQKEERMQRIISVAVKFHHLVIERLGDDRPGMLVLRVD